MKGQLYKVLNGDGACHGGDGAWSLPHDGEPGDWMPAIVDKLVPCRNGYHLCREGDLAQWLHRDIYTAGYRGEMVECNNKVVVREARLLAHMDTWNERTARLFACDCAEHVAHMGDEAVLQQTIAVARRYANGEATNSELAPAWAAAGDTAGVAAWARAGAAAGDTAWDTAWVAAWDTAGATAWVAEIEWQTARLMHYLEVTK